MQSNLIQLPRLSLIDGRSSQPRRRLTLIAQPARPGQFLASFPVAASEAAHTTALVAARRRGIPLEVEAALRIEASRALSETAELSGIRALVLATELDSVAAEPRVAALTVGPQRALDRYVRALRRGEDVAPTRQPPSRLRVSVGTAASWHAAAARAGCDPGRWAGLLLERAPAEAVEWEIAAATDGRTLAEWIQRVAMRLLRNSKTVASASR